MKFLVYSETRRAFSARYCLPNIDSSNLQSCLLLLFRTLLFFPSFIFIALHSISSFGETFIQHTSTYRLLYSSIPFFNFYSFVVWIKFRLMVQNQNNHLQQFIASTLNYSDNDSEYPELYQNIDDDNMPDLISDSDDDSYVDFSTHSAYISYLLYDQPILVNPIIIPNYFYIHFSSGVFEFSYPIQFFTLPMPTGFQHFTFNPFTQVSPTPFGPLQAYQLLITLPCIAQTASDEFSSLLVLLLSR